MLLNKLDLSFWFNDEIIPYICLLTFFDMAVVYTAYLDYL
jgi:hypothetical protein